jgi:release factor glutamine methyltransferase
MTVSEAIRAAAASLAATSDTARLDAELLMAHALGLSRSDMLLKAMRNPAPEGFRAMITRRAAHEPVAYITGYAEFYGLELAVSQDVLIPRADSETLVEAALEHALPQGRVLDCGTGSGALLLAFLTNRQAWQGVGIDASSAALGIAAYNAAALGLGERSVWQQCDWRSPDWAQEFGTFDLVLANPPYVEDDAPLDAQVRDYEPAQALLAGPEGLDDYRILIPQLPALMRENARAIIEIGAAQAQAVAAIAQTAGFRSELRRDLGQRARALVLTR